MSWESDNGESLKCVHRSVIEEEKSKMGILDFLITNIKKISHLQLKDL